MTRRIARFIRPLALLCAGLAAAGMALADEAAIRKALMERLPNLPKIEDVTKTPIPGLWEVRVGGTDIVYTDENGNYLIQGSLFDTKTRTDLTKARIDKLTAVDFASLPLADAMVFKQGSGARKMAVFVDPNCGYCKRFERDLLATKDVTIYAFLYPILGPDSTAKSRDIWCSKDPAKTWRAWMVDGVVPPKNVGKCDTAALDRNIEFGRRYRVDGTPGVFFENGTRQPGALPQSEIEKQLSSPAKRG
jgi:thiol:disulfide interchange protein DsbC